MSLLVDGLVFLQADLVYVFGVFAVMCYVCYLYTLGAPPFFEAH